VRAELELRLRSGREGLLALTITRHTKYRDYCEQVMDVQGGRAFRRLVIYPGEGLAVLTAERLIKN
jgi:hypothetical protein